ncbi:MAG: CoA pyrophosphatase [Bacteroidales bacterium]
MFKPKNNSFHAYEIKLKERLSELLPGERAQFKMAPLQRHSKKISVYTKKAGVLLLLYPKENSVYTVLIKRQIYEGVHSGQISLPGGKMERDDKNVIETAIRETKEEIGIDENEIKILGKLTKLFIPVSDYIVHPIIGSISYEPEFFPNKREVENIYTIKLEQLMDPTCINQSKTFKENNKKYTAPFYEIDDLNIWGATAMILSEFLELYKKVFTQYRV